MANMRYGENLQVVPVLEPKSITATATWLGWVKCDLAHWVSFIVGIGGVTTGAGATCDAINVSVEISSVNSTAGATEVPFSYRLSSGTGSTVTWGSITTGTSDATTHSCSDVTANYLIIDFDPATLPALGSKYEWVSVCITPVSTTALSASGIAIVETRYPGNSIPSTS